MKKILGIELGSTRIKSVLIDENAKVLAKGSFEWENKLENGIWTYDLDDVKKGLRASYSDMVKDYGTPISHLDSIGISAMMHGYLAFDKEDKLLSPFRTWRNTNAAKAAEILTKELDFNMPMRWSGSQLFQSVIDGEEHVSRIDFLTTLSGYVHYLLTGKKVLGVGDASGMFPIKDGDYDKEKVDIFNRLVSENGFDIKLDRILPTVLLAGENAGVLTVEGAALLDESGTLCAGSPLCPPEGDGGTGMVATNSVRELTGNVSAGTSAFVMIVSSKPFSKFYPDLDIVTTPDGKTVGMIHVNNFTSEINMWTNIFDEVIALSGGSVDKGKLFDILFKKSTESDTDIGGFIGYNFLSGEPIAGTYSGAPVVLRQSGYQPSLADFMQMQIYSALGALSLGMDIIKAENIKVSAICGHGGFFKTEAVGALAMSAALDAPITVMKNSGEGGAYGIALLALYLISGGLLPDFLDSIFASEEKVTYAASEAEKDKFALFMKNYKAFLPVASLASQI